MRPAFLLRPSKDKPKQNSTILYSQFGNDFEPAYALKHLDPEQPASKNRYAVGIYDAHNPDILFAEVLLIPDWTQPSLSQDEIRRNGGVTPAPEPQLPHSFEIQLYNPDQQIVVTHKPASLTSAAAWDFEMPSQSFRTPSHSQLDRSQSDPTISELTPKLALKWKKDGRLTKDLGCYLSGRALNPDGTKNKNKEPDITVAIFRNLKEVTIYEPNMARVELEDLKGFEVALLLGAVVIRDVYFGSVKETFNVAGGRKSSTSSPSNSTPLVAASAPSAPAAIRRTTDPSTRENRIPPTDPRSQWEIDQETERLRRQAAQEERQRRQQEEAEQRQIKTMLEAEEKERRRKQAAVDAETERLRRVYGQQHVPTIQTPPPHRHSHSGPGGSAYGQQASISGAYMSGAAASQSALLQPSQQKLRQKSSIFSFRRHSDQDTNKLAKKKSAMW